MSGHPALQQALRNEYFDSLGLPRLYVSPSKASLGRTAENFGPLELTLQIRVLEMEALVLVLDLEVIKH